MSKRIKVSQPITRNRAEEILGELTTLIVLKNKSTTAMDRKITEIRSEYETKLSDLSALIDEKTELLQAWAQNNPEEFPKDSKSIQMVHGVLGFRTGNPKLVTRGKLTWAKVLERLENLSLVKLIRVKKDVNKEQIINDFRAGEIELATMIEIGVQVTQDEAFFIEPKLEDLETKVGA